MTDADDDTFTRTVAVVRRTFRIADDVQIPASTASVDIDGWDSLSHSFLIMNVENEFSLELSLERVFALNDVGELAELVRLTRARSSSV